MVSLLQQQLEGEVTVVETYYAGISPCMDCRYCWTHPACAIDDGMQAYYKELDEADAVVIAFPRLLWRTHRFAAPVGQPAAISVDFPPFRGQEVLKDKPRRGGILLVSGGGGYTDTAAAMARRLLRCMGAAPVGEVYLSGTDAAGSHSPKVGPDTVRQLDRLAALLKDGGALHTGA